MLGLILHATLFVGYTTQPTITLPDMTSRVVYIKAVKQKRKFKEN